MPRRSHQLQFEDPRLKKQDRFGGSLLKKANARGPRPLSTKDPIHLVLRSSQARADKSFRNGRHIKTVREAVNMECRYHGVKLLEFVNVGNHLHFVVRLPSRSIYMRWIRRLTARLAQQVGGGVKGRKLDQKFWDFRPFTRIVRGLRAWRIIGDYIDLNQLEAWGVVKRKLQPRILNSG